MWVGGGESRYQGPGLVWSGLVWSNLAWLATCVRACVRCTSRGVIYLLICLFVLCSVEFRPGLGE
ncbi:hypothetical protein IWZ03DRAFT_384083 [Phyllosticta citriasiana]|uniref:Uncharacterized protein n=1 Tax=Phyllosticta citriasiana TaxID=595635 RepID=A0ABR1KDF4_9PEZI